MRRINHRVLEHAAKLATDNSPAVRREVAIALRDVPFAQAKDLLLTLARGYDGKDRSYLAAIGIGASGKEADLYSALAGSQTEKDATKWKPEYANLVWKLTPPAAAPAFRARAMAASLTEPERLAAVTALGFTPTKEASTTLLDLAQNDQGMVQSHALWWILNYKDTRWKEHGLNAELKSRGLFDPATVTVAASIVPPQEETKLPSVAEIAAMKGDIERGSYVAQTCYLCHRIGDKGVDYAPALTGFANRQTTEVVINSIVNPSSDIAHGYSGTEIVLKDKTVIHGLQLSEGDPLIVESMGSLRQLIPADRVESKKQLGRSLMLSAEQLGLSAQDVADVVAWLKTQ